MAVFHKSGSFFGMFLVYGAVGVGFGVFCGLLLSATFCHLLPHVATFSATFFGSASLNRLQIMLCPAAVETQLCVSTKVRLLYATAIGLKISNLRVVKWLVIRVHMSKSVPSFGKLRMTGYKSGAK